jgi:hypothetical protein
MSQYTHLISESTAGFANFTRIATIFGLDFKTPLARSAPRVIGRQRRLAGRSRAIKGYGAASLLGPALFSASV